MKHDLAFIAVFSAIAVFAISLLGVSGVFGILMTGCLGGGLAALITGRRKVRSRAYPRKWASIFLCSGMPAVVLACLLMGKVYLWTVAIGITGSPYDVPQVSYPRIFMLASLLAFASLLATLAIHDRWAISGLDPARKD